MGVYKLTERGIKGEFYATLNQDIGAEWVPRLAMLMDSDQETETYAWLGQSPAMREWIGERQAKGLGEFSYSITNKEWEATLEILRHEIERDKSEQVMLRVRELARRTNAHWASLLSQLLEDGESTVCYDGQYFFDTDHQEGDSPVQSNDVETDISALPTSQHGSTTAPAPEEMSLAILDSIKQILGFVDDQNEPLNENERNFIVMVPTGLMDAAMAAVANRAFADGGTNTLQTSDFNISLVTNARLAWTDRFATFATDSEISALIRQEEVPVEMDDQDERFKNKRWLFGVYARRNAGYGFWQKACLNRLI